MKNGNTILKLIIFSLLYADDLQGKQLRLGYAYDKTITNLATYNRGSHELMLRFGLNGFNR